jgi:hypothetical protein
MIYAISVAGSDWLLILEVDEIFVTVSENLTASVPPNSGSLYFSCKNIYRIVLLAVVNSNYNSPRLMWGPMGECQGEECSLLRLCFSNAGRQMTNIPAPKVLPKFLLLLL